METGRKLFQLLSFIFFIFLSIFLYKAGKEKNEVKSIESQTEIILKEKPTPVKERFSILMMSDLADSSKKDIVDANGNELIAGGLYLQSKSSLKLYPLSDTLGIYEEAEYALIVDNNEEKNIKVRGEEGFFFIQGLTLLPDVGKEVILDSSNHYKMVMKY